MRDNFDELMQHPRLRRILFNNMMNNMSDAVYFKDLGSRFLAISRGLAAWYGLKDPAEAVGKTDFDFYPEDLARQYLENEQHIIRTGEPSVDQLERKVWPDGHVTWATSTKMPIRDEEGEIVGTLGITRDITELKTLERELKKREARLREQNEILQRDLERARIIQTALLPDAPPQSDRIRVDYRYNPLESVGGDYFCCSSLDGGRGMGVFLGDLAGHGVSAALFMSLIKFLTDVLGERYAWDTKSYLEALNDELMNHMPSAFLTAVYGTFRFESDDGAACRFGYADAGHPLPLVYRRAAGRVEVPRRRGNAALGLIREFSTAATDTQLEPGDRVFLYTDGLPETSDPEGRLLGEEALRVLVEDSARVGLSESLDAVMEGVRRFRGPSDPEDDAVLLGFEVI